MVAALLVAATGAFYAAIATAEKSTASANESANEYAPSDPRLKVATVAGGCFWCVESGYEKIPGVVEAVSGYTGGDETNLTYQQVASGSTGHTEAVQVYYDPKEITYEGLLQGLWRMMNPQTPMVSLLTVANSTARVFSTTTPNRSAWLKPLRKSCRRLVFMTTR